MGEYAIEIAQMVKDAQRIQTNNEIVIKQFEVAATVNNIEEMEKARIAAHEFLDQLFDIKQRLVEIQNIQMYEIFKGLGKKDTK